MIHLGTKHVTLNPVGTPWNLQLHAVEQHFKHLNPAFASVPLILLGILLGIFIWLRSLWYDWDKEKKKSVLSLE